MTLAALPRYLVGNRRAIEAIASSRWSLLIGFLLVLTAGLARNYDGAYLMSEWTVLLHGPVVSTVNALVLFTLLYAATHIRKGIKPPFLSGFFSFLGLFWMTSPMAWLYAIPYERFMTPVGAVEANLWSLALVSVWRVALMTRVLSVLFNARALPVGLLVLLFADVVVFAAAAASPRPIIDLMGGLQHSPQDLLLANATFAAQFWSLVGAPVLFIATLIGLRWLNPRWTLAPITRAPFPRALLAFVALSGLAWVPLTVWGQREQRLRFEAESLLKSGRIGEAFATMSGHRRDEYPAIWDPPPRLGYLQSTPSLEAIRAALAGPAPVDWVSEMYFDKSWHDVSRHRLWRLDFPGSDREPLLASLETDDAYLPDEAWPALRMHAEHDPRLSSSQRERLRAVLDARHPRPSPTPPG